jgi:hypothetical protein
MTMPITGKGRVIPWESFRHKVPLTSRRIAKERMSQGFIKEVKRKVGL